ncbi:MAG: TonB-dependent receptor plug domain-containing protein, partial [Cyanobacteria bacterium P01_H01_bin.105]
MNNKLWGWPLLASVVALMVPPNAVAETVDQRLETLAFGARATIDSLAQGERIEITDVQVENAATGITLWLVANGELVGTDSAIANNAVVVTIPNAELQLTDGDEFLVENPAAGIALITVTNLSNNQVQITITGTDTAPDLGISTAATGLFVNVTPSIPTAQTPDDDALRIVVTGDDDDDYFIPNASTATRTDTPLRDIPNSIQVIPRQVIEDQQATSIEEVLDNAAGISNLGNESGRGINFAIRGFSGAPVLRDGFLLPGSGPDAARPEVANLERVEVLRGPASVLYGQAEPGGVINLVTKQPLSEPYYNLQLQGGNRGFISPSVDLSGPLTDDGRLLYRLNALYRREESFRDFDNDAERFAIAPTLTWLIGDRTDLNVSLEYVEDNEFFDTGTLPFGDSIANVSPSRVFNDPDATIEQDFLRTGYTLEHRFSDNWKLRNRFNYTSTSFQYSILPFPSPPDPNGDIFRVFLQQGGDTDTYSLYTNVQGE